MGLTIDEDTITALLGRDLTDGEDAKLPFLALMANSIIEGYCGRSFTAPVPDAVTIVFAQLITTAIARQANADGDVGVTQHQQTAGVFTDTKFYSQDAANSVGMWLTASLKLMLDPYRAVEGFRVLGMMSSRFSDTSKLYETSDDDPEGRIA